MTINKAHTRVELVEGGSIFKQGDHASLAFTPRDYAGQVVDLSGKDIEVVIIGRKGIIYESTATFDTVAQLIRVEIDQTLDHGSFRIEFIVTDPTDATYRRIFPSEESDGRLTISPSSDNIDFVGVNMTTVTQLQNELQTMQTEFEGEVLPRVQTVEGRQDELETTVQTGIGAFTEDTEVKLARGGEVNLGARLDKTTALLAETVQNDIRENKIDLTAKTDKYNSTTLITGDSLSYSRHDFASQGVSNEASGVFPGIMPWSFMLRDAIHMNDKYFMSVEELNIDIVGQRGTEVYNYLAPHTAQFNGRYIQVAGNPTTEISFKCKRDPLSKKMVLYVMPVSSSESSTLHTNYSVYINDVLVKSSVSNLKDYSIFKGYEADLVELEIPVEITAHEITIKIKDFTAALPIFRLHGVGTLKRNIINTGRGGWRSADLLADINNRILQHNPDILFLVLGANDIYTGATVETFSANMESIIQQVRALSKPCEIILLTPPPMRSETDPLLNDATYKPDSIVLPFVEAVYQVSKKYQCHFINLFELFRLEKISEWRFDNVHFKKYGNNLLINTIVNRFFSTLKGDLNLLNAYNSYGSQVRYKYPALKTFAPVANSLAFNWNGSAFVKSTSYFGKNDIVQSITKISAASIQVTFNVDVFKTVQTIPTIVQFGATTAQLVVRPNGFNTNIITYYIIKNGTYAIEADWNTSDFKFMLSYI